MSRLVDLLQLANAHLCVDLCRLKFRMSKHRLNEPDVGSVLKHQGCHRVTEQVARTAFADVGCIDVLADHLSEAVDGEAFAKVRQKQRDVAGIDDQPGTDFTQVLLDPADGPFADRDHPILLPFPLTHHDRAAVGVQVVDLQAHHFHATDAGGVQGLEDRPVSDAQGIGDVGDGEDGFAFADRQDVLREATFKPW